MPNGPSSKDLTKLSSELASWGRPLGIWIASEYDEGSDLLMNEASLGLVVDALPCTLAWYRT